MSVLIDRVLELKNELKRFPLGSCSPSDNPDKQTAYLYSFREIVKRFLASAKRLNNPELFESISKIDPNPELITEAYDIKAELIGVFDLIDDIVSEPQKDLITSIDLNPQILNNITNSICESFASESANNLHTICSNFGLASGTKGEAFSSKRNYVRSRIAHYSPKDIWELAKKMEGKYPDQELDHLISIIENSDHISMEAKFENIKQRIVNEIRNAKYFIWVAVAWFTDRDLANELYKKSKKGINIQVVVIKDRINDKLCPKFEKYFENYMIVPQKNNQSLMHHKFCVIDMKTVIHGSFNWTIKANYNNETITISEGRHIAESFASEFVKLKNKDSKIV